MNSNELALVLLIGIFFPQQVSGEKIDLTFAVVLKLDAMFRPMMNKAVELAIDDLNNKEDILPNTHITLVYTPLSIEVESNENLRVFADFFLSNSDILGLVGLYNALMASAASLVADIVEIPMITTSTSPEFSDKEAYPYYARALGESQGGFVAMAKIIANSGFRRIAYVATNDLYGESPFMEFSLDLQKLDIQLIADLYHQSREESSIEVIVAEMDAILDKLYDSGARVIVYNAHFDEAQLFLWRAWKKGMIGENDSGEIFQLIFTEDMCFSGLFTECDDEDCKAAMPQIMLKAAGTICIMSEIPIEDDWYQNTWLPNTTKEKLTQNEIDVSGTDDWDKYYNPQSVFSYDSTILLGHALHDFCVDVTSNKNEYATYEDCLRDLTNRGEDVMEYFPNVSFKGATGDITLNENYERDMNQEVFQWTGASYQLAATWIPGSDSLDGSFETHEKFIYSTLDGVAPSTAFEQGAGIFIIGFACIIFTSGIIACMFAFYLLRRDKRVKTKRKVRGFLNPSVVSMVMSISTFYLIVQFIRSLITIGPNGLFIPLFVAIDYVGDLPLIILLAGLLSRSYRFMKVTNNKKMKKIQFSRFHSVRSIGIALLSAMPFVILHYWANVDHSDGHGVWDETYVLQDSNPIHFFELPAPEYDVCTHHGWLTLTYKLVITCLIGGLALGLIICGHFSVSGIVAPSMRKVVRKEVSLLRILSIVVIIMQFRSIIFFIFNENNGNDADHIGFENDNCFLSLTGARINVFGKFIEAISIWTSCFLTCYFGYLYVVPLRKKAKKIRRVSMADIDGDASDIEGDSDSSSYSCSSYGGETSEISKRRIPKNLFDRLRGVMDSSSLTTTHASKYAINNTHNGGDSSVSESEINHSKSFTIKPIPSPSHKLPSHHPSDFDTLRGSRVSNSSTVSNTNTNHASTISVGFNASNIQSQKTTLSARPRAPKFNQKEFIRDLKHMEKVAVIKLVSRLRSDQNLQTQSFTSIVEKINDFDEKLELTIDQMEVLEIRMGRVASGKSGGWSLGRKGGRKSTNAVRIAPVRSYTNQASRPTQHSINNDDTNTTTTNSVAAFQNNNNNNNSMSQASNVSIHNQSQVSKSSQ